jgi:hypothetical protein
MYRPNRIFSSLVNKDDQQALWRRNSILARVAGVRETGFVYRRRRRRLVLIPAIR